MKAKNETPEERKARLAAIKKADEKKRQSAADGTPIKKTIDADDEPNELLDDEAPFEEGFMSEDFDNE